MGDYNKGEKEMREIKYKIYESMKEIPTEELNRYLKEECVIDVYDDLGSRSGKLRLKNEIETELKRRNKKK